MNELVTATEAVFLALAGTPIDIASDGISYLPRHSDIPIDLDTARVFGYDDVVNGGE